MPLRRQLGVWSASGVVVANIIGTGIFTTSGLLLERLEAGWLVLACWALGGLLALAGSVCYAELAAMMPRSGGEYAFLHEIYGPLPAFLSGWISFFVGFSAPTAAAGMAIAFYLEAAGALPAEGALGKVVALAVVLVFTAIHYTGLRWGIRVQNALTALKLILIAALLAGGFAVGKGSLAHFSAAEGFWAPGNWAEAGVALLWVMFAYSGWNAATYISEEITEPGRNLPRSLFWGTVAVIAIYLLFNGLLFYASPAAGLRGVEAVGEVAARALFGSSISMVFSWMIALALLSSLSAYILVGPRVYYAMARDGLFFRFAAKIHPRWQTPALSIALQGAVAGVMVLTATFEALLTYIGFALGLAPLLAVAGLIVLRRREPGRSRPYRVAAYPWVPLFFLAVWGWILVAAFFSRPWASAAALATVLAGVPAYWVVFRSRGGEEAA